MKFSVSIPKVKPQQFSDGQVGHLGSKIKSLLKQKDAVIIAHYYTDEHIQALALATGGIVSDSLEMAKFGQQHSASTLVVCGVYFMGQTAKLLSPNKQVLVPTEKATCSLDLGCPIESFKAFKDKHPERTVVVYANTSAEVKAEADWVVTSSIAVDVIKYLQSKGEKILWAPDQHLGRYIQQETQADMVLYDGSCIVHEEFQAQSLAQMTKQYPNALVLVHPESPLAVIRQGHFVGSTKQIIEFAKQSVSDTFIVASDQGMHFMMQQLMPKKTFIAAPTEGKSAECVACARCPWMQMNHLQNLHDCLESGQPEVTVDLNVQNRARRSLQRMVEFSSGLR
jgi:quinolinate synthase